MLGDLVLQSITLGDGELRIRVGGSNLLLGDNSAIDSGGSSGDRCRGADGRDQSCLPQVRSSILGVSERNGAHIRFCGRHVA